MIKFTEKPATYDVPLPDDSKDFKQMLKQQAQQIALLQSMVMQQNQAGVKLQAANQQQTDQVKQLQQMFMVANQQQAVEKSEEAKVQ
ncbi:hypothetical protein FD27_GL001066 [Limosilactobacillus frumenti DSM 13145]|uniref:Uncharacterized protein n=1 Tax=Limosilactobacillus frumenti DSM 13145 TaxID=1423746 RepID=A0A0R1P3V4_9LACO|nr:hypothetical protein [Limosilactobacillus frumenti]KRL27312.1 hypothetical protein FD27_GL001066 [Limosilactobacillus frumenti DSM 13145]QFG72758.1 hypothetical protein LF145_05155 [Limosilactobacillus frumenti]